MENESTKYIHQPVQGTHSPYRVHTHCFHKLNSFVQRRNQDLRVVIGKITIRSQIRIYDIKKIFIVFFRKVYCDPFNS